MTKILCLTDGVKKKDNDIGHSPLCQNEQLNCSFIKNYPIPLPCGMKYVVLVKLTTMPPIWFGRASYWKYLDSIKKIKPGKKHFKYLLIDFKRMCEHFWSETFYRWCLVWSLKVDFHANYPIEYRIRWRMFLSRVKTI